MKIGNGPDRTSTAGMKGDTAAPRRRFLPYINALRSPLSLLCTLFNQRLRRATAPSTMKRFLYPLAIVGLLGLSAFTAMYSQNWTITEGYSVKFISEDPTGVFEKMTGTVIFDEKDLGAASFNVTIDVASINCGNGMQNRHAKGEKWFDAEKYPTITFMSIGAVKTATGYSTAGKLTMHGITKDLTIPFTFASSPTGGLFTGAFEVSRGAFGIGEPSKKVPDVMKLEVSVPVKH